MARTPDQALAAAERQSKGKTPFRVGTCLIQCRTAYGISRRYASAAKAWRAAKRKHPGQSFGPKGALEFWTGGSKGYGHIAISAGGGYCWSTDIRRRGYFDLVPTSLIEEQWGMKYVGWAEDVNGVRVIKVEPKTRWTILRQQLLDILQSADMQVACENRRWIKAYRNAALAALLKTPKN